MILEVLVIAFCSALLLTPWAAALGKKVGILDRPVSGLSLHPTPVPRSGGLAILLAWLLSIGGALLLGIGFDPADSFGLLLGSLVIAIVGLADDWLGLSPRIKLAGTFLAAVVAVGGGLRWEPIPILTVIWLVGGAHAMNLLDGMDGLAGGVSALAALGFMFLAQDQGHTLGIIVATAVLGAALGFLPYNLRRASVFMGDTGSMLLGFLLASLAVMNTEGKSLWGWIPPLIVLALPILDTALAILRRARRKRNLFGGDREHLYDRLLRRGISWRTTLLFFYSLQGALSVLAMVMAIRLYQNG